MKRSILFSLVLCAAMTIHAEKVNRWFLGGTALMGYSDKFEFSLEPQFGFEFTDRWAIGTGVGMSMAGVGDYNVFMGVVEPFVRFTAWHNELVHIDIKAVSGFGFNDELIMSQVGLVPSLRFCIDDHWAVAADFGLFGAQCILGEWNPAIGINCASAGLWFSYRF